MSTTFFNIELSSAQLNWTELSYLRRNNLKDIDTLHFSTVSFHSEDSSTNKCIFVIDENAR